jgi:Fungal N-terminal domain of STAND proteins
MSFGFSVGDFLAVSKLIADLISSLRESGGSKSHYQEIIRELEGLDRAIKPLENLANDASPEVYGLKCAAASCRAILEEFHNKVKKYHTGLSENASDGKLLQTWKKIRWTGKKEYLDRLRQYLQVHQANISIMLMERNMASTKLVEKSQRVVENAVKDAKERTVDTAKEVRAQGALIATGNSLVRRLFQLLNGTIKPTLMEVANYTKNTL